MGAPHGSSYEAVNALFLRQRSWSASENEIKAAPRQTFSVISKLITRAQRQHSGSRVAVRHRRVCMCVEVSQELSFNLPNESDFDLRKFFLKKSNNGA
jgi:hypothetical protein